MKVALVTGASRGIGKQCAIELARTGYSVAVNYNSSYDDAVDTVKKIREHGGSAFIVKADVSDFNQVKAMVDEVNLQFGRIDILVNNAGIAEQKLFTEICPSDWDRMFAVNVTGIYNCCSAVVPPMISRKEGVIVNISSMWGISGASCESHYSATKAAVIGFTKSLAKELGPSGIRVNCVAPGVIKTEMCSAFSQETMLMLKDETPLQRLGEASDVANAVVFLSSKESSFITGQVLSVDGGYCL